MLHSHQKDLFSHIVAGAVGHFLSTQQKANTEDESFRHKGASKTLNQIIVRAYCKSKSEVEPPVIPFEDIFARHLRQELINHASETMPSAFRLWVNGFKSVEGILTLSCFILFMTGIVLFSEGVISFPYFTASFLIGGVFGMVAIDEVEKNVLEERDRLEQEKADDVLSTLIPHSSQGVRSFLKHTPKEEMDTYKSPLLNKSNKEEGEAPCQPQVKAP